MKVFQLTGIVILFVLACSPPADQISRAGTIAAGGFKVYYEQTGDGEPILFLHAGLQDHSMWAEQVKALSKKYKVVTIDMPFHGKTSGTDTSILAKDIVRIVLDSLGIEKATIAGLSMGAAVAQDFIIGYPRRVSKVILMAAGLNGYEQKYPVDSLTSSWYPGFLRALEAKDTAGAALEFAMSWGEGIDRDGDSLKKPASRFVYQKTLATLQQHKLAGWPNLQDKPTAFDEITNVKKPVLIIHGDRDLPFIAITSGYMEKNIPGARRVLLKGAAHMLNMEQPVEVNRLILDFLKQ